MVDEDRSKRGASTSSAQPENADVCRQHAGAETVAIEFDPQAAAEGGLVGVEETILDRRGSAPIVLRGECRRL
jgi:hypothetical protein